MRTLMPVFEDVESGAAAYNHRPTKPIFIHTSVSHELDNKNVGAAVTRTNVLPSDVVGDNCVALGHGRPCGRILAARASRFRNTDRLKDVEYRAAPARS